MRTIPLKLPQGGSELLTLLERHCSEHYGRHQLDGVRPILQKWARLRSDIARASPRAGSLRLLSLQRTYLSLCVLLERHFASASLSLPGGLPAWSSSLSCTPSRASSPTASPQSAPAHASAAAPVSAPGSPSPPRRPSPGAPGPLDFWSFEKACAIFNCAACLANAGLFVSRERLEEFQEALDRFLKAGAILRLLRETLPSLVLASSKGEEDAALAHACPEFSFHGLTAYIFMLQAQAQCVSYERALREKLGKSLLSKLASQVASFYASALSHLQRVDDEFTSSTPAPAFSLFSSRSSGGLGSSTGALSASQTEAAVLAQWLRTQELAYLAAAHFQMARHEQERVEAEGEGYGRLVARLRVSRELLSQASDLVEAHALKCNLNGLLTHIVSAHAQTERDNSMVYLEAVPDPSRLAPLEQVCCIELPEISLKDLMEPDDVAAQLLSQLIPSSVRLKADEYRTKHRSAVRGLKRQASDELARVSAFLVSHQLPGRLREKLQSLEEAKTSMKPRTEAPAVEVPTHLWGLLQSIQAAGGLEAFERQHHLLTQAAAESQLQLREIADLLRREEGTDVAFRECLHDASGCTAATRRFSLQPTSRLEGREGADAEDALGEDSLMLLLPASELAAPFKLSLEKYQSKAEQAQTANLSLATKLRQAVSALPLSSPSPSPAASPSSSPASTRPQPSSPPRTAARSPASCAASSAPVSIREVLRCRLPSDLTTLLQPLLRLRCESRQPLEETRREDAAFAAKANDREARLSAFRDALADLETAVNALQQDSEAVKDDVDIESIHSLLLRARQEGEPFDAALSRVEADALLPQQERTAELCRCVLNRLQNAASLWDAVEASEASLRLLERASEAVRASAVREAAEWTFRELEDRARLLLLLQQEQEEGVDFFCQLRNCLRALREQIVDWRAQREEERTRLLAARRARLSQGNGAQGNKRDAAGGEEKGAVAELTSSEGDDRETRLSREGALPEQGSPAPAAHNLAQDPVWEAARTPSPRASFSPMLFVAGSSPSAAASCFPQACPPFSPSKSHTRTGNEEGALGAPPRSEGGARLLRESEEGSCRLGGLPFSVDRQRRRSSPGRSAALGASSTAAALSSSGSVPPAAPGLLSSPEAGSSPPSGEDSFDLALDRSSMAFSVFLPPGPPLPPFPDYPSAASPGAGKMDGTETERTQVTAPEGEGKAARAAESAACDLEATTATDLLLDEQG